MDFLMIMIGMVFLAIVQIQIFKGLPETLRNFLAYIPLLGIIANFMFSQFILHFVGLAYGLGLANMFSSVIFGLWLFDYKKKLVIKKKFLGFPTFYRIKTKKRKVHWTD